MRIHGILLGNLGNFVKKKLANIDLFILKYNEVRNRIMESTLEPIFPINFKIEQKKLVFIAFSAKKNSTIICPNC